MYIGRVVSMGVTKNKKLSFIGFFEFLVSWREMRDEKQKINFLHFLPNFGQNSALFDDFSKYNGYSEYITSF